MPIGNVTWDARVGVFYSLKAIIAKKLNTRKLHYSHISLLLFFYFITIHLCNFLSVLNCIMTSCLRMLTELPKIAEITLFLGFCIPSLLFRCGDNEKKPGPTYSSLIFCHWNLNGLTAHDSIKISLLQAYVTQHNYDIICLSETFLNSSIDSSDTRILIDRYNLMRSDHSSDSKRGGVCIYYKEHIPVIKPDDICTLDKCLVTEIRSQSEK